MRRLLPLLALAGCAAGAEPASVDPNDRTPIEQNDGCRTVDDCRPGQLCRAGLCSSPPADEPVLLASAYFEVLPPVGSEYGRAQSVQPLALERRAALRLPAPARPIAFTVRSPEGERIAARITLSQQTDAIPGRALLASFLVSATHVGSVPVPPGTYEVRIVPADGRYPGMLVSGWTVAPDDRAADKDFELPATFRVLSGVAELRTTSSAKLAGVTVQAFAAESGLPSTIGRTDANGRFELRLPETEETLFRVDATPEGDEGPAWSFRDELTVTEDRSVTLPIDPTPPESRAEVEIVLVGEGLDAPVGAARVVMTASIAPSFRFLQVEATSDGQGRVVESRQSTSLTLLAARYRTEVLPGPTSPFGRLDTHVDLRDLTRATSTRLELRVPARAEVSGRVLGPAGAVPFAEIELVSLDTEQHLIVGLASDGEFTAHLDRGRFLAKVSIPSAGGAPGWPPYFAVFEVAGDRSLELGPIGPGFAYENQLLGARGEPIADADVSVFAPLAGRVVSLGATRSAADGTFSLILPDPRQEILDLR